MILDAETLMPAPAVEKLVGGSEQRELPGLLKTELHASVVELNTRVIESGIEALDAVRALRGAAAEIAADNGLAIAAAGAHPLARPRGAGHRSRAPLPRLRRVRGGLGHPPGGERAPYPRRDARPEESLHVAGRHPRLAPARSRALGELALLAVATRREWRRTARRSSASCRGGRAAQSRAPSPSGRSSIGQARRDRSRLRLHGIWWDARVHPKFGTLEIRSPDQPTSVALTAAFVALFQALCAYALAEPRRVRDFGFRVVYDQNRWAASRFGPRATFIHPEDGRAVEVSELARGAARPRPPVRARARDGGAARGHRSRPLRGRPPARGRPGEGLQAACRDLVERTVDFD